MFSVLFVALCLSGIQFSVNKSKPTDMFVNPVAAKNYIVDRYLEIQAMPEGLEKKQAHKIWQQNVHQIKKRQRTIKT